MIAMRCTGFYAGPRARRAARRTARGLLILLAALILPDAGNAGPFEDGLTAYDSGQPEVAFKLWLPLAEQGSAGAQFNIATMYENGSGTARDASEAARWYLAAAKQGDADAQFKMGMLYEDGAGVVKDAAEARKWYDVLIANPRTDKVASAAKQRARLRLAALITATQDIVAYSGGRFVLVRSVEGTCVIALQGAINRDTQDKFADVTAKSDKLGCDRPWLMLESPGGLIFDGFALGREVRSRGFRTLTRYDCASACAIIFLGGVERMLAGSRARVGLHQASIIRTDTKERWCDVSMDSPARRELRRYLVFAIPATASGVMDVILHTSCNDIEWVSGQRALDMGIATSLESAGADMFGPKAERK